jgi:hypothetical protein
MDTNELQEIINDAGYDTRSYSGRGMYGKECLAYEVSARDELYSVAEIMELACDPDFSNDKGAAVKTAFRNVATDSMGRDNIIIYFPKFEVKK